MWKIKDKKEWKISNICIRFSKVHYLHNFGRQKLQLTNNIYIYIYIYLFCSYRLLRASRIHVSSSVSERTLRHLELGLCFIFVCFGLMVFDKVWPISESLVAGCTLEGLLPRVHTDMGLETEWVWKDFATNMTLILFFWMAVRRRHCYPR